LKYFFKKRGPQLDRMVLVESGPREIFEKLIPLLYPHCPAIDLVTCYGEPPSTFLHERGEVFQVGNYQGKEGRSRLYDQLRSRKHAAIGIICADLPIMTKWKWALAANVPAKLFVVNENGDFFWADYSNWRIIVHFVLFRAGLTGADAVPTLTRLAMFPFTLVFLVFYASLAHARRRLRRPSQHRAL
jgi:hypothetical protein